MGTDNEQGQDAPEAEAPQAEAPEAEAPQAEAPEAEAPEAGASSDTAESGAEHDPWPFDLDDDGSRPELSFAGEEDMTLDAFERAVSRAVHDKLGAAAAAPPPMTGPPRGADELVASVLGALTGKDPRAALDEVREQLATGPVRPQSRGADIIDLQAVRDARRRPPPSDFSVSIGNALKDTFNAYLAGVAQRSGRAEFTIDAEFLKKHGPNLLGNLFQGLAETLLPQAAPKVRRPPVDLDLDLDDDELAGEDEAAAPDVPRAGVMGDPDSPTPAEDGAAASDAAPERPSRREPPPNVSVKVDLGSILANLFKRRPPPR